MLGFGGISDFAISEIGGEQEPVVAVDWFAVEVLRADPPQPVVDQFVVEVLRADRVAVITHQFAVEVLGIFTPPQQGQVIWFTLE